MFDEKLYSKFIIAAHYIKPYLVGLGVDVGCGTNRLHPHILALDQQPDERYAHPDIVWNCKNLDIFKEQTFDFIFSSHCLEDFENIPEVFRAWWTRLKIGGVMILLLPDMENGRYPKVPGGNPSHRVNTGPDYFRLMLARLDGLRYEILQIDTVPHDKDCSFDLVIKRTG